MKFELPNLIVTKLKAYDILFMYINFTAGCDASALVACRRVCSRLLGLFVSIGSVDSCQSIEWGLVYDVNRRTTKRARPVPWVGQGYLSAGRELLTAVCVRARVCRVLCVCLGGLIEGP
jgi:hypothetical protein